MMATRQAASAFATAAPENTDGNGPEVPGTVATGVLLIPEVGEKEGER